QSPQTRRHCGHQGQLARSVVWWWYSSAPLRILRGGGGLCALPQQALYDIQVQKYLVAGFKAWQFSGFTFPTQPLRRHAQIPRGKAQWKKSVML
ncbi:MAG: hypothetical protein ACYCUV_12955, partial [Phycisphaerae bacterium]